MEEGQKGKIPLLRLVPCLVPCLVLMVLDHSSFHRVRSGMGLTPQHNQQKESVGQLCLRRPRQGWSPGQNARGPCGVCMCDGIRVRFWLSPMAGSDFQAALDVEMWIKRGQGQGRQGRQGRQGGCAPKQKKTINLNNIHVNNKQIT